MASKNKGPGLRVLWIPGRKKHDKKGIYSTTNKEVKQFTQQKKNESWSLGGAKEQNKLINM